METLSIVIMNWRDIRNPEAGGAELYIHEITKRWANVGHTVTLLTSGFKGAAPSALLDGVTVQRQGTRYTVYRKVKQAYLETYRGRTDVVIDSINTIPFFTPKYVDEGTRLFVLIFQLAREGWFYETPWPIAIVGRYLLEDRWLRLYSSVPTFTLSESTSRDLLALGFRSVSVVHPGVPPHPDGTRPAKAATPTLLFVGRLKKYKLPHHAIAAYRRIRERIPDAQLWVVGDGYMRKQLEKSAPPGVTLFGYMPEREKVDLMQRAHLLLCPSVREGWGLVVTEANSLGLPAIGYDVPGLRDSVQHGVTGFLVPANNPEAMAEAAAGLLMNQEKLRQMGEAAREWAGTFDWNAAANSMLQDITERSESSRGVPTVA